MAETTLTKHVDHRDAFWGVVLNDYSPEEETMGRNGTDPTVPVTGGVPVAACSSHLQAAECTGRLGGASRGRGNLDLAGGVGIIRVDRVGIRRSFFRSGFCAGAGPPPPLALYERRAWSLSFCPRLALPFSFLTCFEERRT